MLQDELWTEKRHWELMANILPHERLHRWSTTSANVSGAFTRIVRASISWSIWPDNGRPYAWKQKLPGWSFTLEISIIHTDYRQLRKLSWWARRSKRKLWGSIKKQEKVCKTEKCKGIRNTEDRRKHLKILTHIFASTCWRQKNLNSTWTKQQCRLYLLCVRYLL